jgi:hypothetical protein
MTRNTLDKQPPKVEITARENQIRLKRIAAHIKDNVQMCEMDKQFIYTALREIANGKDANKALGVISKRGIRKGKKSRDAMKFKVTFLSWIAAAMLPKSEAGLGYTLEKACAELSVHIKGYYTEETLRTYWNKNPDLRNKCFRIEEDD